MDLLNHIDKLCDEYWNYADHRMDDRLFMSSIKPVVFFLVLYFLLTYYGPRWMRHRKPYNLHWLLFAFNMAIALYNLHIFKELILLTTRHRYNWLCEPVRKSTEPDEMRIVTALHLYFLSKVIELLDTVFIVLRKKEKQLSFLHVYHHSSMLLMTWIVMRWIPGGSVALGSLVNALIHVLMYSYYGMSVLGPKVSKYLWWKRYITVLQLVQFMLGLSFGANLIVNGCPYPTWLLLFNLVYMLSYIILFGKFYVSTYVKTKSVKQQSCSNLEKKKIVMADDSSPFKLSKRRIISKSTMN